MDPSHSDSGDDAADELDFGDFRQPDDAGGLSLEALSAAYAELIDRGTVPYEGDGKLEPESEPNLDADVGDEDDVADCDITPRSILEAMLFVGNPENECLKSQQVAGLMRGVRPQEIDDLVVELNAEYESLGSPYGINSVGDGYVLQLRDVYEGLRNKFYRRVREARLSQTAVDVLAIVAYRQPLKREEVDKLRGRPSGSVLSQLVRRQLLRLERPEDSPRRPIYFTTDRFLTVFGLDSLGELPQS
jgi:segregation and condensation protein B